jgi:hypothetical protein
MEPDFSPEEANGLRTCFEMVHRNTVRWIEGAFDGWQHYEEEDFMEIQQELSNTEKALQAMTNLSNEYHTAISFNIRTPIDHPQFQQLQMQFLSGLQLQITKPRLLISNLVNWTFLLRDWKTYSKHGGTSSILDSIDQAAQNSIKIQLMRKYSTEFIDYKDVPAEQIPEKFFLGFILLMFTTATEADKKSIETLFLSVKMNQFKRIYLSR